MSEDSLNLLHGLCASLTGRLVGRFDSLTVNAATAMRFVSEREAEK